jgi:hypothetical protein
VFMKMARDVIGTLLTKENSTSMERDTRTARSRNEQQFAEFGRGLPHIWDDIGERIDGDTLQGCKRVVVIGIHGWFPGTSAYVL